MQRKVDSGISISLARLLAIVGVLYRDALGATRARIRRYFAGRSCDHNIFGRAIVQRPTALLLLIVMFCNAITPAVAAVQSELSSSKFHVYAQATPIERYGQLLGALKALLDGDEAIIRRYTGNTFSKGSEAVFQSLSQDLQALGPKVDAYLADVRMRSSKAGIDAGAIATQEKSIAEFAEKNSQLVQLLKELNGASRSSLSGPSASTQARALRDLLREHHFGTTPQHRDFTKLPWDQHKADPTRPRTDAMQFAQSFPPNPKSSLSKSEMPPAPTANTKAVVSTTAPSPEDLVETIDVRFTNDVEALATQLGKQPVRIYEWVRNNVSFLPTYGSAQGTQDTLDKRVGNGFDQASLLIALLRYSGIPARYVYGTIEIPADQAMNWVGEASTPEAALQMLSQGGIPSIGLTAGGHIKTIRIEHVWVEAWLSAFPGRGAVKLPGDTWISMDPSFKQYNYSEPMNLAQAVPFDSQGFSDAMLSGATANGQEGWVKNLNVDGMEQKQLAYEEQLSAYVAQQKANATVGDVLGYKQIRAEVAPILALSLPYVIQTTGARFSTLPDSLRHHFQYNLYTDSASRDAGTPVLHYDSALPSLAGKKLTLLYAPATAADEQLMLGYVPAAHADGSAIAPEELPATLPASINLKAQLLLEGSVVASAGPFRLGDEILGRGGFTTPDLRQWDLSDDNSLVAGQPSAIGLSVFGISEKQLTAIKSRIDQTALQLQADNASELSGDRLTGDFMTAAIWVYLSRFEIGGSVLAPQSKMIDYPGLSYGLFNAKAVPNRLFGAITTSVRFPGVELDVSHLRRLCWSKIDDAVQWARYNQLRGQAASGLEHSIVEGAFAGTGLVAPDSQGVSAVKLLALAERSGDKIFAISADNLAAALPQVNQSADVLAQIRDAVEANKVVLVSENPVTVGSWQGAGLVITDPATGSGAYLIEGGSNGAFLEVLASALLNLAATLAAAALIAVLALFSAIVAAVAILLFAGIKLFLAASGIRNNAPWRTFWRDIGLGLATVAAGFIFGIPTILAFVGAIVLVIIAAIVDGFIYAQAHPRKVSSQSSQYEYA